jgi:hypothetical protein
MLSSTTWRRERTPSSDSSRKGIVYAMPGKSSASSALYGNGIVLKAIVLIAVGGTI